MGSQYKKVRKRLSGAQRKQRAKQIQRNKYAFGLPSRKYAGQITSTHYREQVNEYFRPKNKYYLRKRSSNKRNQVKGRDHFS